MDANQTAEKDEFEDKQKELEGIFNPIIQNLYGAGNVLFVEPFKLKMNPLKTLLSSHSTGALEMGSST